MSGVDRARIEAAVSEIILAIGEDPARPGLAKTPARVADAYAEFFGGLSEDPLVHLRDSVPIGLDADGAPQTSDAVLLRGIDFPVLTSPVNPEITDNAVESSADVPDAATADSTEEPRTTNPRPATA